MAASMLRYEQELVRIRREYLDSLPKKIRALEKALSGLSENERPAQELADLYQIAHQLAASAGSHGLEDISEAALQIDRTIEREQHPLEDEVALAVREMGDALVDMLRQPHN